MSAEKIIKFNAEKVGIIAGQGDLPLLLADSCVAQGVTPFIIGYAGTTSPALLDKYAHMMARLGGTGAVIKTLKAQGIRDLILLGAMKRPNFTELRPDIITAKFYASLGWRAVTNKLGDDAFLKHLRRFLEGYGFTLHGAHIFLDSLLTERGALSDASPNEEQQRTIQYGFLKSQKLGADDIGQSVIVRDNVLLGVEGAGGTNALFKDTHAQHGDLSGAILVKTCKPQQDKDIDLPTIGIQTIDNLVKYKMAGVAVHAGASFIVHKEEVAHLANQHKLFVIGVEDSKT